MVTRIADYGKVRSIVTYAFEMPLSRRSRRVLRRRQGLSGISALALTCRPRRRATRLNVHEPGGILSKRPAIDLH